MSGSAYDGSPRTFFLHINIAEINDVKSLLCYSSVDGQKFFDYFSKVVIKPPKTEAI